MSGPAHAEDLPCRVNPAPPCQVCPHLDPSPRRSTGVAALVSTPPGVLGHHLWVTTPCRRAALAPNGAVSPSRRSRRRRSIS
jgi:hypothetical protein